MLTLNTLGASAVAADTAAPTVATLSPADNATGVAVGATLSVTFSETVRLMTGVINLYDADDDLIESFDVATDVGIIAGTIGFAAAASVGTTLTIRPTGAMEAAKGHYVQIAATAIDDLAGNSFAGIADKITWNFTTA